MAFVLGVNLVLAFIIGGVAALVFRKRRWLGVIVGALVLAGGTAWFLHPTCMPIASEDLASFSPPIESHVETGLNGQRYFQRRGDGWYHCKAWIERELFF